MRNALRQKELEVCLSLSRKLGLGQDLFTDVSGPTGLGLATRYLLGFGIGLVDVANRGRLDVLITHGHVNDNRPYYPYAMPPRLYENRPGNGGFKLVDVLTLRLEGTRPNRDGVGARVTVLAGRHRQVAQRLGGGSYQSASDPRLHFGIGERSRVESVEVRWPSGRVDQWIDLAADTCYLLREGAGQASPLPGFQIRRTPGK